MRRKIIRPKTITQLSKKKKSAQNVSYNNITLKIINNKYE